MNPNCIIKVFVFVVRCKLYINSFVHTWRYHPFFVIFYFEIGSAWWQNMKSLRSRWVIYHFHFQRMCLSQFKSGKFHHWWGGTENAVWSNRIKFIIEAQIIILFSFSLSQYSSLEFDSLFDRCSSIEIDSLFASIRAFAVTSRVCTLVLEVDKRISALVFGSHHSIQRYTICLIGTFL